MRRRTVLAGAAGLALWPAAAVRARDGAADEGGAQLQDLSAIKAAIEAETGYDDNAVALSRGPHRLVVRIINGRVPASGNMVDEAVAIAAAVSRAVGGAPSFADVGVLHVDYIGEHGDTHTFSFRRDAQGGFTRR